MLGVLTDKNVDTLSELMYMNNPFDKGERMKFAELPAEKKALWKKIVELFIDNLAKLEFEPRPLGEKNTGRKELSMQKEELGAFIKDWVAKKVKVPKNLDKLFPSGELGIDIIAKYGK